MVSAETDMYLLLSVYGCDEVYSMFSKPVLRKMQKQSNKEKKSHKQYHNTGFYTLLFK